MARIEADREICVGAGMCVRTAPVVFAQDETDGRVVLILTDPSDEVLEMVRAAVAVCPSGAIALHENSRLP